MEFRQIEEGDFGAVHDLALKGWVFAYKHIGEEKLKELVDDYYSYDKLKESLKNVESGNQFFLLAFDEGKFVGFCSVVVSGELLGLYIEPELVGQGLGKSLLKKGEEFLVGKNIGKYFTFVNKHNSLGFDFYVRNEFKRFSDKDKDDEFESKVLWYMEKGF